MQPRYLIDQITESVWYILDQSKLNSAYLLFATHFPGAVNNWSVNLVSIIEENYEFIGFEDCLFSIDFYVSPAMGMSFMRTILLTICSPGFDIENPVQLCYVYGAGRIHGEYLPSLSRPKPLLS